MGNLMSMMKEMGNIEAGGSEEGGMQDMM